MDGGEAHWTQEYRFQRADGSYMFTNDRGYVVRGEQGRAVRLIGTAMDVTERRRAEDNLRFLAEASALLAASLDYQLNPPSPERVDRATPGVEGEGHERGGHDDIEVEERGRDHAEVLGLSGRRLRPDLCLPGCAL